MSREELVKAIIEKLSTVPPSHPIWKILDKALLDKESEDAA